jgi:DNA-binding transcriptional MerR regulator
MNHSSGKLFYKIGEVCEIFGVEPHVLRYWESEFGALSPQKNRAGQRIYRKRDLELIETIHRLLYDEGYTISGARKKLQGSGRNLPLFQSSQEAARRTALRQIKKDLGTILEILES